MNKLLIGLGVLAVIGAGAYWYFATPKIQALDFNGSPTEFATDGHNAYYLSYVLDSNGYPTDATAWHVVQGADVPTFSVIGVFAHEIIGNIYYAKDANHVYASSKEYAQVDVIPEADPSTFVFVNSSYAKDATHVFAVIPPSHMVEGADPDTFKVSEP